MQSESSLTERRRIRANQRNMVIAILLVAAAVVSLYFYMRSVAAERAKQHQTSFYEYIVTHHIGVLHEIDDGTGFDPMSYVLVITHPVTAAQLRPYFLDLMHRYVLYDHGQSLTLVYQDPKTHKQLPMAVGNYDDDKSVLSLTLTPDANHATSLSLHVHW